ncbi:MAG: xanthine dehydrogenase family protein molybdopterin-binding subunit, partial [Dehalococcoidia bacterium]|nr:xanthine dehydrogenase family protein molybdopterin-binding subunit [Dehalococcoidia bacterium]
RAVLTGKDVPEGRMGVIQDRPLLAQDVVRFVGEPVAMVAAESLEIAEEALDLIEVDYEELPAVFDVEEAMKPRPGVVVQPGHGRLPGMASYAGQPFHAEAKEEQSNVYRHFHLDDGDVEHGFKESDAVVENRFVVTRTQHCAMEPHCAMARPEPDGGFTVWASEQHPYEAQGFLSRIFKLPLSKVRVITPYIGGGFGGKLFVMASPWAILLAQKTGRPVKVVYSREEVFVDGLTDVSMVIYIKDGVKKDGRLWARKVKAVLNCGAYSGRVLVINDFLPLTATVNYRIPHFSWDSHCVATNEPVSGPLRGFGGVQLIFAIESQMDMLAKAVGMDPYQFRRLNLYKEGEKNLLSQTTYASEAQECLDKVAGWIGWAGKSENREEGSWRMGRGIAAQAKGGVVGLYSLVDVKVHADGTIEIRHSATEVGQGCHTVLAQMAAEEFQTSVDKVRQIWADTAVTPYDITSTADLTTFNTGNSLLRACQDAKRQIFELAAERLKARAEELELKDGTIYVKGRVEAALKLGDLFVPGGGGTARKGEIIGHGVYAGRAMSPEERGKRLKTFGVDYTESYGACAAEVAVNIETGEVKVLRLAQCHDMGTPVNPQACEAQMDGGTGMGIGRALYEDIVIENGVTVNPNFVDYKLPSIMEVPLEDRVGSMLPGGVPHKDGPYGAKGFGESTSCDVAPAIANAIYDAVGVRVLDLPITREKVLEALKRAG